MCVVAGPASMKANKSRTGALWPKGRVVGRHQSTSEGARTGLGRGKGNKTMRKFQVMLLALVALCAFSAFASSAFALTWGPAVWLISNNPVAAATAVTTTGGLTLRNALNGASMLCEGIFDGTVNTGGEAEVKEVLNLSGVAIASLDEAGATGGISCVSTGSTCETGSEAWPGGLPWKIHIEQDENLNIFRQVLLSKPIYFILCLVFNISVNELCEATEGAVQEIINVTGGVEAIGSVSPNGPCGSNAEEGELIADGGNITTDATTTLKAFL